MKNQRVLTSFIFLLFISVFFSSCKMQDITVTGVQGVMFKSIDPAKGQVTLDFGLKVNNPNNFSVNVKGADLDITLDGVSLGKVTSTKKVTIAKMKEDVYWVEVNAQITNLLSGIPVVMQAVKTGHATLGVKGTVKAGRGMFHKKFPVDIKQQVKTTMGK